MATFKALFPYQKADGTIRTIIRLTHNRKIKQIKTEIYITKDDLTKKGKLKSKSISDDVNFLIEDYNNKIRKLGNRVNEMNVDQVYDYLTKSTDEIDFIAYGRKVAISTYNSALNSLVEFLGTDKIDINDVKSSLLKEYSSWYLKRHKTKKNIKKGTGERGLELYLTNFKTIISLAKKEFNDEDEGIIRVRVSPFNKLKLPKVEKPKKRALSVENIIAIRDADIKQIEKRKLLARDVFMLSFYLCGINSIDLFYSPKIKDGRLTYKRSKTSERRKDGAEISIKIEPEAQQLMKHYVSGANFKFSSLYENPENFNKALNIGLKQLGKQIGIEGLTYYAARHSWATIAANKCKIDIYTIHQALNHANKDMEVTEGYIDNDWSAIDEANRKVLDFL
ncbi:MAG: phage integrase SAM-like domain-containing protein [Ignavibacteria bacterium]|nr:phage integrase SAM-like domain-containing protein [Ignavibacteria bacterium]